MKGWIKYGALLTAPLILVALVFQAGRHASLASEARALETEQREWVDANRKLLGGISVLESRERAAELARRLGLVRASADKRLFIELPSTRLPGQGSSAATENAAKGKSDG
ncbi:MAG: hypothetical protein WCL50_13700 [Spirochaetota bacterium]